MTAKLVQHPYRVQDVQSRNCAETNCAEAMRIITDASGELIFSDEGMAVYWPYANSAWRGASYYGDLADGFRGYASDLFSQDPDQLDFYGRVRLGFLLLDMISAQDTDAQDLWQEARIHMCKITATDTDRISDSMLREMVTAGDRLPDHTEHWVILINRVFANCSTDLAKVDHATANRILFSILAYSPRCSKQLRTSLSRRLGVPWNSPITVLHYDDCHTFDILERVAGVDRDLMDFRRMQISILKCMPILAQILCRMANDTLLNLLLIFASGYSSEYPPRGYSGYREHMLPLIRKGADVNYVSEDCPFFHELEDGSLPRTPLGAAVYSGRIMAVVLLLDHGADILLDTDRCSLSKVAFSRAKTRSDCQGSQYSEYQCYMDLAEMLEKIETEERAKRNFLACTSTGTCIYLHLYYHSPPNLTDCSNR